jgi:hypothetical protein
MIFITKNNVFVKDFWKLWAALLQSPILSYLQDAFSLILGTFYKVLPDAVNFSRLISPFTGEAISLLFALAPDSVLEFLKNQRISVSFCFMVGIIRHEPIFWYLPEILNCFSESTELDVVSSILFSLSRNIAFLERDAHASAGFARMCASQFFVSCDHQTSVLLAINHVSANKPDLLPLDFIDFLFQATNDRTILNAENFLRLCRILSKLVFTRRTRELTDRLKALASGFLESPDRCDVAMGAEVVWAVSSISLCGSYLVTQGIWQPLLKAMDNVKGDHDLFQKVVGVLPSALRSAPWSLCQKTCTAFLRIAEQVVGQEDVIVDTYNQISQCHIEFKDWRDRMCTQFVQKMMGDPGVPFFEFFTISLPKMGEEQMVMSSACNALGSADANIGMAAARLLKRAVRRSKELHFLGTWEGGIIRGVFLALLDGLHAGALGQYAKLIFAIYQKHLVTSSLTQSIDDYVINAISDTVDDLSYCRCLAQSLRMVAEKKGEFVAVISDFLISSGRVNPHEMKAFTDGLEIHSLSYEFTKQGFEEERNVLRNEDEFVAQFA